MRATVATADLQVTDRADGLPGRAGAPAVIAHRGASGHRPENTLAAVELAIAMDADMIEVDVVVTADGVVVVHHDLTLDATTDIATRDDLAERRSTRILADTPTTGWFVDSLTLTELSTLRSRERYRKTRRANTVFDGLYAVPTLAQVVDRVAGSGLGLIVDVKAEDVAVYEQVASMLAAAALPHRAVASFRAARLQHLSGVTEVPLMQLLTRRQGEQVIADGLADVARYAVALGPNKGLIDGAMVRDAHRAGLRVYPYTFRNENRWLSPQHRRGNADNASFNGAMGDAPGEYARVYDLGVDGVITDHPDTAAATRSATLGERPRP